MPPCSHRHRFIQSWHRRGNYCKFEPRAAPRTPPSVKTKFESAGDRKASTGNFFTIVPNYQKHRSHHQGPPFSLVLTMHATQKQLHCSLLSKYSFPLHDSGAHISTHDCIGRCLHRIAIPTQCSPPGQQEVMQERTAAVKLFFNFTRSIIAPPGFCVPDIQIFDPNAAALLLLVSFHAKIGGVVICKSVREN